MDLPEPFSPTRNVTPGASSMPSATTWATAGTVSGHCLGASGGRWGSAYARTTGGWLKSMSAPYDREPLR
ncbi:hypothetical protein [Nocardioides ungokensis]|uniref:hypothetical protein n=1 Tax=Nocardioides ungokensis TaxID=1643322 RepID=UPI001FE3C758|nr:hypothetical protein [Nocardioides ungokensis]